MNLFEAFDFDLLDSPDFKEDSVREELILPILRALGYSSKGTNRIVRSKRIEHPFVSIGSKEARITNFPDYLLEVDGRYAWVLDAKGPAEDAISGPNKQQAYFYAIHPDIDVQLYALCNGRELVVFRVNQKHAVLRVSLEDIAKRWQEIYDLLGPTVFSTSMSSRVGSPERLAAPFDHLSQRVPEEIKKITKQAAKRHFGVHGYFTKQAFQILQKYIETFSAPGDMVLDPFGGTGVTLIEALIKRRSAIHVDLNPLSVFWVNTLIRPVSLSKLEESFDRVVSRFSKLRPETTEEIEQALQKYPYPHGIRLPKDADVEYIEELFSRRQLAQLALLKNLILEISDEAVRDHLLLSFSSSLNKFNLTFHYTKSEGGGDSGAFRYYRYRLAKHPGRLELISVFRTKFKRLLAAKRELSKLVEDPNESATVVKGTATDLDFVENESVDYIYTDPPYGKKIQYLDLSIMFNAWLGLEVSDQDRELEAIEGGQTNKSKSEYTELIRTSIAEMFRVLKFDRWMSFVFQHQDPAYWHLIVETAEKAGFEYVKAVRQNNGQTSFKKRQRPFTTLSGQLIINFRKVKNPKSIMKAQLGADITDLIHQAIEDIIAHHSGASMEEINDEIVIKFMELNILDLVAKKYKDLSDFLMSNFDFDQETKKYHLKKDTKFRAQIPVEVRIKYYLLSMLGRLEREGRYPHIDDIYLEIMPLLKNGTTPEEQTILNVLRTIAMPTGEDQWRLSGPGQGQLFDLA